MEAVAQNVLYTTYYVYRVVHIYRLVVWRISTLLVNGWVPGQQMNASLRWLAQTTKKRLLNKFRDP